MSEKTKYIQPVYLPKCDYCNSNIMPGIEKYYFVSIEGGHQTDVRIVHRECFVRNQTYWAREDYENWKEQANERTRSN